MPALGAALGRAFADDPVSSWFLPAERRRERQLRRFFTAQARILVRQEVTWTADDGVVGGAVWALPNRWRIGGLDALRLLAPNAHSTLRHAPRALRGLSTIERQHPVEPHLYLATLGVEPSAQGNGIGSELLQRGLAVCDADGIPAYLESSKRRNVDFYSRYGFRVTGCIDLPGGGPPVWLMWREPRR